MFPQWFHRLSTGKTPEKDDLTETVRTLIDARFDRIESQVRTIKQEWLDCHDKLMLLYDRTRKRIKVEEKARGATEEIETAPAPLTRDGILSSYIRQNGDY